MKKAIFTRHYSKPPSLHPIILVELSSNIEKYFFFIETKQTLVRLVLLECDLILFPN